MSAVYLLISWLAVYEVFFCDIVWVTIGPAASKKHIIMIHQSGAVGASSERKIGKLLHRNIDG